MKLIRVIVGFILIVLDKLTSPWPLKITDDERSSIQKKSQGLELFEFNACPFCIKVRRFMKKNNINVPLRDAKNDEHFRQELLNGGGRVKVPCLKISNAGDVKWLYESNDIIAYFQENVLK
jgi:glutaredoxin